MKKIVAGLLASTAVIGFGLQANAEVTVGSNGQVNSDATINVKEGEAVPTEPENPDTPSGETGQNGPLSIDNVITFNFEDISLTGGSQNVNLQGSDDDTAKRNIQVTDTRGTGAGWNLQIKQSELKDGNKTLAGAFITMNNSVVVPGSGNVAAKGAAPTVSAYNPTTTSKSSFAKLVTAAKNQGLGTYKFYYNQDASATQKSEVSDIQLVVPSGNLIGNYSGTVTWALQDSPTGTPAS